MGSGSSAQKQNRNNGANEHAKRSTRHSDKHEAPKQTTSESTEVEATVGMKNRTLEANINNGPSNQRGRSFKAPTDKHSQTSANSEDQRKASGDEDFKRHASSKSKTAEWQIQYTGPNDDARTDDCGLPAMDAKDACISATPSTSREENRVESVNRNGEVSYTTKTEENHATTNETKKMHEYERKVERLEAEIIKLTQEKNQLLNRQEPEVLEQVKENRENKPRKTKEKERSDEVSYTTKTNENHAIDSANDRKKIHEYEKKVERLEADVIRLTQEKDQLLNRQEPEVLEQVKENRENKPRKTKEKERSDEVSYTTKTNENHAIDSANDRKKIHEYEKKVERLEADVIRLTQEKDQLLNRQVPDVLEQKKNEDRENKPRKTKENERNDEVSYTTKTNENHAIDSANDRKKIHEYEKKVERLEADVIRLTQEKDQLLNRRDDVSSTTNTDEIHTTDLTKDKNKYHEYKTKVESLEADVMKLRKENETLLNRLKSEGLEEQIEDGKKKPQKTKEEKRRNDVPYTTNTDEKHATDLTNEGNKLHEYERKAGHLEADVIKLREEKGKLLHRLSEVGAIKLTENNHKVTDLSDENRPEKVAEQFSELYDTEWTDAYENLTKIQCKQADWSVKQLLDVLKETYTICVSSTQEKMKALKEAISNYVGLSERDATDLDLKETKKRIQEHRKKMFQTNISNIGEEVRDQLKKKLEKEIYECLSDYIGKCVIICWNMCTKEPPMYLDFGDWKQAAQSGDEKPVNMPFDKLKFVTYTKSGDYIDYVVWPAVYICEGGPLMKKGVAQGSKLITNTMEDMENEDKCKMAKE